MSHFFYSFIKFCIGLIFVIAGAVAIALPWSPPVRTFVVDWILQGSTDLMLFGIAFAVIGLYLIVYSLMHSRVRYHRIRSDDPTIMISEPLVQDYLGSYWQSLFPQSDIPFRLQMNKKKIAIQADLPFIPLDDQKEILKKIESELTELFRQIFGYRNRLDIAISFKQQQNT